MPQSPNDRGPTREQIIFRFKLPGRGESIQGIEQKRNSQDLLPLPPAEIESWRMQLTDCWRGWQGMDETVKVEQPGTLATRAQMQNFFNSTWAAHIAHESAPARNDQ